MVQHNSESFHDIRSITKSVISSCIGIAIEKGFTQSVFQKISDFFAEFGAVFLSEKANWSIQNFLSMTSGIAWNEKVHYNSFENDEILMSYNDDPVAFVLAKPLLHLPGKKFNYSGGDTQILAEIIARASNISIAHFVNAYFFKPLGNEVYPLLLGGNAMLGSY